MGMIALGLVAKMGPGRVLSKAEILRWGASACGTTTTATYYVLCTSIWVSVIVLICAGAGHVLEPEVLT